MAQRSPMRFVAFLLIMAVLFGYIAWKWREFNRQTVADDGGVPIVVVGSGQGGERAAGQDEAVPASGERLQPADAGQAGQAARPAASQAPAEGAFFAEGRMERDRARSQQVEILKGIIGNQSVGSEARAQAEAELVALSRRIAQEVEIENLLRARGFADALVYLYPGAAMVIVRAQSLTPAQVAQVADTVSRVAGIAYEAVSVLAKPE